MEATATKENNIIILELSDFFGSDRSSRECSRNGLRESSRERVQERAYERAHREYLGQH